MKKALLILGLITLLAAPLTAQTQTVDQAFIDSANRAFKDVVALRDLNAAKDGEIQARKEKESALDAALKAVLESNATLREDNKHLREMTCSVTSFFWGAAKVKRCK